MGKLTKEKKALIALLISSLILYISIDALYATILLLILLLVLILGKIVSLKAGQNLSLSVEGRRDFEKNDLIEVNIVIKNSKFFPVFRAEISLLAENVLTDEKYIQNKTFSIGMNKEYSFPFTIKENFCGCINFQLENFYLADPFLLFKRPLDADISKEIYVLPGFKEVDISSEHIDSYDMESYKYSATRKGDDSSETFGIAEYVQGDSMKAIHWKLSSKLDELMVREHSHPIDNRLMIILDKNIPDSLDITPSERDSATELFLSISDKVLKQGIDHTVGWHNHNSNTFESKKITKEEDLSGGHRYIAKCSL